MNGVLSICGGVFDVCGGDDGVGCRCEERRCCVRY